MDNYVGKRLDGRYELQEVIGVGGMAVVYKAYDNIDDRTVAVKILKDEFLASEEFRRRFKNESKAIAVLSHPNIVKVYDVSYGDKLQYIVMEYVEGITLKEYIEQQGVISWKETVHFTTQILRALQHAHDKGIVHRDIKPDNLFYMNDGTLKIADFGISAPIGRKEKGDAVEGTVYYCAPEVLTGKPASIANDIYSMGVVFYEMLVGSVPFDGVSAEDVAMKQISKRFPEPSKTVPSIPRIVDKIIITACRKRPEERYQSASEMHEAILKAMQDKENFKERKGILSRIFGFK